MAKPFEIPLADVQKRLALDNPWWIAGGSIDSERKAWPRRAYFTPFMQLIGAVQVPRAVVLIGARRVGKTVMLAHAVQALLDEGVAGSTILYVSLDTPLYSGRSLESLVRTFMELHHHGDGQRLMVQ